MAPTLIQQVTLQDGDGNTHFMNLIISENNDAVIRIINVIKSISDEDLKNSIVTSLNTVNRNGENALILAIKYGTEIMVSNLLGLYEEEFDDDYENLSEAINQKDMDENNALMCSIIRGHVRNMGRLVEDTENIRNHVNRNGDTALLLALKSNAPNHKLIANLLIDRARRLHNYDLPDRNGNTAKSLMTDDLKEIARIPIQTARSISSAPGSRIGGIKSKKNKQKKRKSLKKKSAKKKLSKRKYRKAKQ